VGNEEEPPLIGECWDTRQRYSRGETPSPAPAATTVGTPAAVADGFPFEGQSCWEFTAENGAAWSMNEDRPLITFEDSQNCGGDNSTRQQGSAECVLWLNTSHTLTINLSGHVENQNNGFDLGRVQVNGTEKVRIAGEGGLAGCVMIDRTATVDVPLSAGQHSIRFTGDTIDGLFHTDAFFECHLVFSPPLGTHAQEVIDGFLSGCFLDVEPPPPPPWPLPSIANRQDWLRFTQWIVDAYDSMVVLTASLQDYFGGTATINTVNNTSSLIPGTAIAYNAQQTVVIIPGTTNFQQIAMQGFDPIAGLTDFGDFSTAAIWASAYAAIDARIVASGAPSTTPILFAGHSYGGVVACLLGALYKQFQPARDVQVFTLGSPRPGDARLVALLDQCERIHLANHGDGITAVPPVTGELVGLLWLVGAIVYNIWTESAKPGMQSVLSIEGELTETNESQLDYALLYEWVVLTLGSLAIPEQTAHFSAEYLRRIKLLLRR